MWAGISCFLTATTRSAVPCPSFSAARAELPGLLAPARVCVLPLPINDYTNLAVAVRLLEYLGFGKPIVATDTTETRAILAAAGAGRGTSRPWASNSTRTCAD